MASSHCSLFLFIFFSFVSLQLLPATANIYRKSLFASQFKSESHTLNNTQPVKFFEVTKPIELPQTSPCSKLVLQHDFSNTLDKPPVLANYTPPLNCASNNFEKIVLEWKATSIGRQFDRIFGVWLGGVELMRSCTAEPTETGIVWTVEKDITKYYSSLMTNQTLAVYMGNIVDSTYTGVYHVNINIHFYPAEHHSNVPRADKSVHGYDSKADLIFPVSRNLPLNAGLWFQIENSTDVKSKEFKVPQNSYRAVLEVYVSPHENDEFWYTNYVNEYIQENNLTGFPGNGPFREVVVSLDGKVVGAVWPFTVIYTGGIDPHLWKPITAIGSYNLPSYDIEITPSLGVLLDGKTHKLAFRVTNALNVWYVDANLHIWLDKHSQKTEGKLLKTTEVNPPTIHKISNSTGLNGTFSTKASRLITSAGWVKSSHGKITTTSTQNFNYRNYMVLVNNGNAQVVNQTIDFKENVIARTTSSLVHSSKYSKKFQLYLSTDCMNQGNDTHSFLSNLTIGFNEIRIKTSDFESTVRSSLKNKQTGNASMIVKDHLVRSGVGSTEQEYKYVSIGDCYQRSIGSSNYTIVHDSESNRCT